MAQLLDAVERVLKLAARAERQALRWEDPLPVPDWVAKVREEMRQALAPNAERPCVWPGLRGGPAGPRAPRTRPDHRKVQTWKS